MSTLLKTLLATSAFLLSTQAFAEGEQMCLAMGDIAKNVATAQATGLGQAKLLANLPSPKHDNTVKGKKLSQKVEAQRNMIINYVYTMQLGEADAAKMVYLKCRAGEYDNVQ